jgi:hypothetical protein
MSTSPPYGKKSKLKKGGNIRNINPKFNLKKCKLLFTCSMNGGEEKCM